MTAHRARALPVIMEEAAEASEEPQPAAEAPAEKAASKSQMPKDFLGFIDVTTGGGSLLASLIVAGGFGLLVEFIKYAPCHLVGWSLLHTVLMCALVTTGHKLGGDVAENTV